jgi:hypothetical protein
MSAVKSNCIARFFICCAPAALAVAAQDAQRPEMTARELFYNAASAESASAQSAPPAQKAPAKRVAKKAVPPAAETQQAGGESQSSGAQVSRPTAPIIAATDVVPMRTSAPPPATGTALGLKYTVLKLVGDTMKPVAPSSVFHAGDKIQFSVETNGPGYLYIVSQGSSGTWKPMFPSPEIAAGSNNIEGFHSYTFPSGYRYVFDQQAGDEKIFLILSRDAKPDFEELVYSLQGGKTVPSSAPRPAEPAGPVLRASIDDSMVGRLHQTYARDLVIEKVGDDAPADTQEKAVYVVNPSGSSDSAVVADIHLVHR